MKEAANGDGLTQGSVSGYCAGRRCQQQSAIGTWSIWLVMMAVHRLIAITA
jgi:hypothetical protein